MWGVYQDVRVSIRMLGCISGCEGVYQGIESVYQGVRVYIRV